MGADCCWTLGATDVEGPPEVEFLYEVKSWEWAPDRAWVEEGREEEWRPRVEALVPLVTPCWALGATDVEGPPEVEFLYELKSWEWAPDRAWCEAGKEGAWRPREEALIPLASDSCWNLGATDVQGPPEVEFLYEVKSWEWAPERAWCQEEAWRPREEALIPLVTSCHTLGATDVEEPPEVEFLYELKSWEWSPERAWCEENPSVLSETWSPARAIAYGPKPLALTYKVP